MIIIIIIIGVSSGCEAAVHSARRFFEIMPEEYVFAKLGFTNAFNSIHRDAMLGAIYDNIPQTGLFKVLYKNI